MKIGIMSFAQERVDAYVRHLVEMPGIQVLAADPDHEMRSGVSSGGPERAHRLQVDYVDSYRDLVAWQPAGVLVFSETSRHRELIEWAARAGAQVLCPAPLAPSLADAEAITATCRQAEIGLMVAQAAVYAPAFRSLHRCIQEGQLGTLMALHGSSVSKVPDHRSSWLGDTKLSGGGALIDRTPAVLRLIDHLLGGASPDEVYATVNQTFSQGQSGVETAAALSLRYPENVVATIDSSWCLPNSYPTDQVLTLQAVGTRGTAELDVFGQRVDGHSELTGNQVWLGYDADLEAQVLADFVTSLRRGTNPQPDGPTGLRIQRIIAAAYDSVASSQPAQRTIGG